MSTWLPYTPTATANNNPANGIIIDGGSSATAKWVIDETWAATIAPPTTAAVQPLKCTCGITKTMGPDADIAFHSDWCDLRRLPGS
jgi:hypothetical protein